MKKLLFLMLTLGTLSIIAVDPNKLRTSSDGRFTLVESDDGTIVIIDTQTGKTSTVPKKVSKGFFGLGESTEKPAEEGDIAKTVSGWLDYLTKKK